MTQVDNKIRHWGISGRTGEWDRAGQGLRMERVSDTQVGMGLR